MNVEMGIRESFRLQFFWGGVQIQENFKNHRVLGELSYQYPWSVFQKLGRFDFPWQPTETQNTYHGPMGLVIFTYIYHKQTTKFS